ncbi:hypothetical protein JCM8547_006983 [Rhodosporidiobolus lusitaniae]
MSSSKIEQAKAPASEPVDPPSRFSSVLFSSGYKSLSPISTFPVSTQPSRWARQGSKWEPDGLFLHVPLVCWEAKSTPSAKAGSPAQTKDNLDPSTLPQLFTPTVPHILHDTLASDDQNALFAGQIVDGASLGTSDSSSDSAAVVPLSAVPGLGGISDGQAMQLKMNTGAMRRIKGAAVVLQHVGPGGARMEERRKKRAEEKLARSTAVGRAEAEQVLQRMECGIVQGEKAIVEFRAELDELKRVRPSVDCLVQTDAVPPAAPLIITRPSSPVFLPADHLPKSNDSSVDEMDRLKRELRERDELLKEKDDALRSALSANSAFLVQHRLTASLFSLVERAHPVVEQDWQKVPLPSVVKDYALRKAMDVAERVLGLVEGGKGEGLLDSHVSTSNSALSSSSSHPPPYSDTVKWFSRLVRDKTEENADLLIQLAATAPSSHSSSHGVHVADIPSLSLSSGTA